MKLKIKTSDEVIQFGKDLDETVSIRAVFELSEVMNLAYKFYKTLDTHEHNGIKYVCVQQVILCAQALYDGLLEQAIREDDK